ncbi:AAA family ATPase [Shimia thalassica]|uniref:AAA family ATPase n=1 Tax=Shimia thalassica TaxID=1715693 RepID=UPI001C08C4EF|nr:AAA family ATPase [Shimia thalassica]MBU2941348.1 AAA family ATPase [Shimia thalassica]MDO6503167.1 AAA family ATPase [Shimia thalassica]
MLKIKSLSVEDIGGISKAQIKFHPSMNVICGPNGVGKTTILDIIVHMSTIINARRLKRRAGSLKGLASAVFMSSESEVTETINVSHFDPVGKEHYQSKRVSASDILYLRNIRLFDWEKLTSISSDPQLNPNQIGQRYSEGIPNADAKNWFVNRYLYSAHKGALTPTQLENFAVARKAFAVLDTETQFDHVEASTNEVMVRTPKGLIPYEYLSSGFKTCVTIFWGLIKEIEYSRSKGEDGAASFDGIILIDELELHLHPVWQSKILQSLKSIFPKAQFIVTTHSPHIVQSADCGEVMPLEADERGNTQVRDVPQLKHGMAMWTIEEVLEDIMGMKDTRTEVFNGLMKNFERAILSSNEAEARKIFEHLQGSLHPRSAINKILALQIASIRGSDD